MRKSPVLYWLWEKTISTGDIAMATGVAKESVFQTLLGADNNRLVLNFLRAKGCPEHIIQLRKKQ